MARAHLVGGARATRRRRRRSFRTGVRSWRAAALEAIWAAPESATPRARALERAAALARREAVPLSLYALLTVAMTYPLVLRLGTHLPGNGHDAWQNLWNFWWTRTALSGGQNPYRTPLLYAPDGAPLYLHTLNLFNGVVTLPVQLAFGVTAAYNAVVFLSFILAAYFAFLLVAHISGSRTAGFVGGAIYGFSAYHFGHLYYGQTNLLASEWLPAYALCLLLATEAGGRRRTLLIVAAALALALLMLCDWQYAVFAALFTALYAPYRAVARRRPAPLLVAAAIGALWLLVALPLLLPTIGEVHTRAVPLATDAFTLSYSADLLSFVVPNPRQAWWRAVAGPLGLRDESLRYDRAAFLGYLPLALALGGAWSRRGRFWVATALLFALLALGPALQVGGATRFGPAGWELPLPYRLIRLLPGVNISRVPSRFVVVTLLCLAVLAGLAVARLMRRVERARGPRARVALVAVLVLLLLAEQLAVPFPTHPVGASPFFQTLADSTEAGAVLELPLYLEDPLALYHQTIHRRPLVGGYLSRDLDYPLLDLPPFRDLLGRPSGGDITGADPPDLADDALRFAGVRWIAVRLDEARLDRPPLATFLVRYVEPEPLYRDAQVVVYRPRLGATADDSATALRAGAGWYDAEPLPDNRGSMRWFERDATINAWNFGGETRVTTLHFDAWSFNRARRLEVWYDGQRLGQWTLTDLQQFDLPLTLTPGQHRIELRSLDPPTRPVDAGVGRDPRALAFGVANVALQR